MLAERDYLQSLSLYEDNSPALSNSNVSMPHEDGGCVRHTSTNALSRRLESAREFRSFPDWRLELGVRSREESCRSPGPRPADNISTSPPATSSRAASSSPRQQTPPATTCRRRSYPTPARRTASSNQSRADPAPAGGVCYQAYLNDPERRLRTETAP